MHLHLQAHLLGGEEEVEDDDAGVELYCLAVELGTGDMTKLDEEEEVEDDDNAGVELYCPIDVELGTGDVTKLGERGGGEPNGTSNTTTFLGGGPSVGIQVYSMP